MTIRLDYNHRVALVTGASSGMGRAAARAFAEAGASTVLLDFNPQAVNALADELTAEFSAESLPPNGGTP
jgi:NAD(P)-dependent dehydrogenase (short-subunit alcohol dehydrogenase family)